MFSNPAFLARKTGNSEDIHNDVSQPIQGGVAGEHYHLSAALYQALINLINNPRSLEPVINNSSETIYVNGGDIVTVAVAVPPALSPVGGTAIPPTSIPDVVSPTNPINTEPAFPSLTVDPYWNNVVVLAPLDEPLFSYIYTNYSKYAVAARTVWPPSNNYTQLSIAGADSPIVNTLPRFGKNTAQADATNAFLYFPGGTSYLPNGTFIGDFTVECDLAFGNMYPLFAVGNSIYWAQVSITTSGNGKFVVGYNAIDSNIVGESALFVYPWVANTYYHFCIERKGIRTQFRINGVLMGEIACSGKLSGAYAYADYYANVRATQAIARYNLSNFVPPSAPYPRG